MIKDINISDLIDQLEEPNEIELSEQSAWKTIAKLYHPNEVYWGNVRDKYLESLEEQEKIVVPEWFDNWYKNIENDLKSEKYSKRKAMLIITNTGYGLNLEDSRFENMAQYSHVSGNKEKYVRAVLDGYTYEKEKRYTACFAPIGTRQGIYLYRESGSVKVGDNMVVYEKNNPIYHLTEQEIRNIDERFWAFAEEVEVE